MMEIFLLSLLIVLLIGSIGAGLYYLNDLRRSVRFGGAQPVSIDTIKTELDARYQADIERLRAEARGAIGEIEGELDRLREGLRSSTHEHDTQLSRLRDRYAEVDGQTAQALEQVLDDLRAHQETELARLREAVGAVMATIAVRQSSPESTVIASRRADAIGSLYRRLAKLETSFLSVTNPVLLPGEAFQLPAEILPETLKWENWKEVGDASFAFADAFNQDRIFLDDATCRDLVAFVGNLRGAMTTAIYPNLSARPGSDESEALQAALAQLGREIPEARELLEHTFRENE